MSVYYNYKGLERGACSTVIIGKSVSTTGKVIMGIMKMMAIPSLRRILCLI